MADEKLEIEGLDDDDTTEIDFDDEESTYDSKSPYQKPLLAMEAVRACREARGTEMKQGFWNMKLDRQNNAVKTWMEDQRKVFINRVVALRNLLAPECLADEKFTTTNKNLMEKEKGLFETYAYTEYDFDEKTGGWRKTNIKFIPQIDEEVLMPTVQSKNVLTNVQGGWNRKINAYYDNLIPVYDELFEELNKVIARLNDFAQKFSY